MLRVSRLQSMDTKDPCPVPIIAASQDGIAKDVFEAHEDPKMVFIWPQQKEIMLLSTCRWIW